MERLAARLGVSDRVRFVNQVPRSEMLSRIAQSGVLLHPPLHDESPLVVSEALSLGTPLVALDHGGARALANAWPSAPSELVAPSTPTATARRLARAVDSFLRSPAPIPDAPLEPAVSFREMLQTAYHAAVGVS
jgi:glycosyltransferase involved in cell wall biosynthesis